MSRHESTNRLSHPRPVDYYQHMIAGVEDLWVSVDEFVAEPVRWLLETLVDGRTVALTRNGEPIALLKPSEWTLQRIALHQADSAEVAPGDVRPS